VTKKILFQDTTFRDGIQSFFGARVRTRDLLPAMEAAVHAGINHFEVGGGALFQSPLLYCGESPFDRMDALRKAAGSGVTFQTLSRGINVVGLSQQPKDMIALHAKLFKKHGINIIRDFDALNDIDNLKYSGAMIKNEGLTYQPCVTLMELPPGCSGSHDAKFYISKVKEILESGIPFDSICFKDASGTSAPEKVYETVKGARALVGENVVLWFHTHATAGIGELQNMAAIRAGITGICLSRKPISGGTAQVDLLTMAHALKGTDYTLDIDYRKILDASSILRDSLKDYFFPPEAIAISPEVILSPMPGGALTANTMMMRDTNTLHLYPKVIEEMGVVIAKGGFGTSVTPLSQFYFQQAFANVTMGRWSQITQGYGETVLGYFGKTPTPPDAEVVALAKEQLGKDLFKGDPLESLSPGIPEARALLQAHHLSESDENIFIIGAMKTPVGNKGLDFLKGNGVVSIRKNDERFAVEANGKKFSVSISDG